MLKSGTNFYTRDENNCAKSMLLHLRYDQHCPWLYKMNPTQMKYVLICTGEKQLPTMENENLDVDHIIETPQVNPCSISNEKLNLPYFAR